MAKRKAKDLFRQVDNDLEDIMDVGLRPIQRFLGGNGWKRLPKGHQQHSNISECWEKKLSDGKTAWMFEFPESVAWNRGKNPYGLDETTWRLEIYRANPRHYEETTLPETPMLYLLRAVMQRLSTWNPEGGEIPGGSGEHTYF
jgi:hypothetical protein